MPPHAGGARLKDDQPTRWVIASAPPERTVSHLARALGISSLTARLLASRGIDSPDHAAAFTSPSLRTITDPSALPGCDRAARRILDALDRDEPVIIYGDYDADGITASAILYHAARHLRPNAPVSTYVPHRIEEGYGLNADAIRSLADDGAGLIVSVDCGITAARPALAAKHAGVDLIITDHHNPPTDPETGRIETALLPDAHTLVHPRLPRDANDDAGPSPDPNLCGAGVAFNIAWRLCSLAAGGEDRVDPPARELLLDLLALAALGTIADLVPLTGDNRLIARFGLTRLKATGLVGVRALLGASSLDGEKVTAEDAGFKLAPRLNACGRMGHARDAIELLTTDDAERAEQIARDLDRLNNERRATEKTIAEHAAQLAETSGMTAPDARVIVLAHDDWHPGVIGIVCSRLVERHRRPVVLLARDGDTCKGSGRSIAGYSLHDALAHCREHLRSFGGHDMAAGLALDTARFERFADALAEHASGSITDEMCAPTQRVDCDAAIDEIMGPAAFEIERLGPFGMGHPRPALRLTGVRLARHATTMGRNRAHLDLRLEAAARSATPGSPTLRAVAWSKGDLAGTLRAGQTIEAVVRPTINRWQGRETPEVEILDLRTGGRAAHPSGETRTLTTAPSS